MFIAALLFFFSTLSGMEFKADRLELKCEVIKTVDEQRLVVSSDILKKFTVIENVMNLQGKSIRLKTNTFYTKKNFKKLFECSRNYKLIRSLKANRINQIIDLAGNLGACKKFRKKLTVQALKLKVPVCIEKDIGLNSVADIDKEMCIGDTSILDLSNRHLHSLQGIERFSSKDIRRINLSKNRLRTLDIPYLLRLFPNLKDLNVNYNKLLELKLGIVPDEFYLHAMKNKLTDLEPFTLGENCVVSLKRNKLSRQVQNRIMLWGKQRPFRKHVSVILRGFWIVDDHRKYYPKIMCALGFAGMGGVGIGTIMNLKKKQELNKVDFLCLLGGLMGVPLVLSTVELIHLLITIKDYIYCYLSVDCLSFNHVCGKEICSMYDRSRIYF